MIVKKGSGSDSPWTFAASARDPFLLKLTILGEATFNPEFYLYSASLQDWSQLCIAEVMAFFSDIYCSESLATVALWELQYLGIIIAAVGKEHAQNRRDINMYIQCVKGEVVQRKTPLESSST